MPADATTSRKPEIHTITTTAELAEFCELAKAQPYVTLDTEFLRERTYYSKLCLIQAALPPASGPKSAGGPAVLIDPLAEGLSLEPLYDLFRHKDTVKVFHAARQDLEIFFHDAGVFPGIIDCEPESAISQMADAYRIHPPAGTASDNNPDEITALGARVDHS